MRYLFHLVSFFLLYHMILFWPHMVSFYIFAMDFIKFPLCVNSFFELVAHNVSESLAFVFLITVYIGMFLFTLFLSGTLLALLNPSLCTSKLSGILGYDFFGYSFFIKFLIYSLWILMFYSVVLYLTL